MNNQDHMNKHWREIYPKELQLNKENTQSTEATFLDLNIKIHNKHAVTSIYDKRDNFPFEIISYPDIRGNIAQKTGYASFTGQCISIFRNCMQLSDASDRVTNMVRRLMPKGYNYNRLRKTARKLMNSHGWISIQYNCTDDRLVKMLF